MNYLSTILSVLLLWPTFLERDEKILLNLVHKAEVVVVAEVLEVHPSPGFWSGVLASVQHVKYRIVEVLKGEVRRDEIDVGHYVVSSSLTADKEQARLSPQLFKQGNRLVLVLSRKKGHGCKLETPGPNLEAFCSPHENYGAVPADTKLVDKIRNGFKRGSG